MAFLVNQRVSLDDNKYVSDYESGEILHSIRGEKLIIPWGVCVVGQYVYRSLVYFRVSVHGDIFWVL